MKQFKLSRFLYWFFFNGIFAACGYYGLFESVDGARRVFLFLCWLCVVFQIVAVVNEEIHAKAFKEGTSVPRVIGGGFDIAISVALVWCGYYVTAAFYVYGSACEHYVFTVAPKTLEPNK